MKWKRPRSRLSKRRLRSRQRWKKQ
ncbi:unnamed protein product, partial [Gulo gulo]